MNPSLIHQNYPATATGIKTAGVGKKGSKPLSFELIEQIILEFKEKKVPPVVAGAFWGGLLMKGLTDEEENLKQIFQQSKATTLSQIVDFLSFEAPADIKALAVKLISKEELNLSESRRLGQFLFSNLPGDGIRGLAASVLRVRYETDDEYQGLLESMQATLEMSFRNISPSDMPIIQMAEPFDGVDHSNIITPLLANFLQKQQYRVVTLVGRNSGPKLYYNLADIAAKLNATFLKNSQDLNSIKPALGWYVHQADISKALDRWVDFRRQIIKRPFVATLERFMNPVGAKIIIASAFHPPYGEKMITIAKRMGYQGCIIVRNGIEGSIAFPLKRPVKILCSAKQKDGSYISHEMEYWSEDEFKVKVDVEEKLDAPSLDVNVALIQKYLKEEKTENELFDLRIRATCDGINRALSWLNEHIKK